MVQFDFSDNPYEIGGETLAAGQGAGRTTSRSNTVAMGADVEMWSGKDRLRRFEISQRNAGIGEPALIPGTGDFADFSTSLTKNGYSVTHDVWDSGLSKIAVYKADGSSSSVLADLGMRSSQKDRSLLSVMADPIIGALSPVVSTVNNGLTYVGAKFNGDAELAAIAADALASRTTAEAGLVVAGGLAGARLSGSSKAAPVLETNSAEAFAARPGGGRPAYLTPSEFNELPHAGTIDPRVVRYSQDSASANFRPPYGAVDEFAQGLSNGTINPATVDPVRLVVRDGKVYTLDNRRLYGFEQAGVEVPYTKLDSIPKRELFKFTTQNGGTSIVIRRGQ